MSELAFFPVSKESLAPPFDFSGLSHDPASLLRVIHGSLHSILKISELALLVIQDDEHTLWNFHVTTHVAEKSLVPGVAETYSPDFWTGRAVALRKGDTKHEMIACLACAGEDSVLLRLGFSGGSDELKMLTAAVRILRPVAQLSLDFNGLQRAENRLSEEVRYFRDRERKHYVFKELIRESFMMQRLYNALNSFVDMDVPVLLGGEGGTGKELLARALHHLSKREGLMVAINCRTTRDLELDHGLFGSTANAFSGINEDTKGVFELAENGTVYLEEIDSLSPIVQGKILRILQDKEVRRTGARHAIPVDVRLVASCHGNLEELAASGKIRQDLYAVLSRHVLVVPPLRERKEDILPLARIFLRMYANRHTRPAQNFSLEVKRYLEGQTWPGNVRELQTRVESAVLKCAGTEITLADFCLSDVDT